MSVRYTPVGWNANKIVYDALIVAAILLYVAIFIHIAQSPGPNPPYDDATIRMRAFGSCAFLMLSFTLAIGPLARLDPKFLPLLYNRRHLGVATCIVALTHAGHVLGWYLSFSAVDPYVALLSSNTSYARLAGFPFELFGLAALIILLVLAATSHDFWLSFLTAPVWKALHMSVYAAYAFVVAHVTFGALLAPVVQPLQFVVPACALALVALHLAADSRARREGSGADWIEVGPPARIREGRGIVVPVREGESVAIFRDKGRLSAIANACAHQNGPLGEGRIVDGCITCPWHGFQYRPEDGCSPPPFTEKVATYNLKFENAVILLDPRPNAPGTRIEPLTVDESRA